MTRKSRNRANAESESCRTIWECKKPVLVGDSYGRCGIFSITARTMLWLVESKLIYFLCEVDGESMYELTAPGNALGAKASKKWGLAQMAKSSAP